MFFSALRLLSNPEVSRTRDGGSNQDKHRDLVLTKVRALINFHTESKVCPTPSMCFLIKYLIFGKIK